MTLTFCPPTALPLNASSIIHSTTTKTILHSRTLAPITKPPLNALPPHHAIPGPSHQPTIGSFPAPPAKKNYKRVAHQLILPKPSPVQLVQQQQQQQPPPQPPSSSSQTNVVLPPQAKKRKLVSSTTTTTTTSSRSATPSSSTQRRSSPHSNQSRRKSSPATLVEESEDEEVEWNKLRTLGARTRSSTPKETGPAFGTFDEKTQSRVIKTSFSRQDQHVGIKEDGCVPNLITSESIVRPIIGTRYKRYFHNPNNPNDKMFEADPENYPVVELEFPNWDARDRFILLSPVDKDHYHPINELLEAIYTMISCYLLPQEQTIFGALPDKYEALNHSVPKEEDCSSPSTPTPTPTTTNNLSPLNPNRYHHHTPNFAIPSVRMSGQDPLRQLEKAHNTRDGPAFVQAVHLINSLIRGARDRMMHNVRHGWHGVPPAITKVVLEETYQRAVGPNVKELGKYPPFSDLVYGELNMPFVQDILFRTEMRANNKFVDLGCGVGNCLIQAALQTGCTANGIELNPPPATLGKSQVGEYHKRLRLWGISSGPVTLLEGNFCERPEVRTWISEADLVLVNNWAFSAELNMSLAWMFLDLPSGAKVVSMKPFRRSDFRLTDRTADSPEAIFRVEEVQFRRGTVSWMAEGGVYYLHTVDREPLRLWSEKEKQRGATEIAPTTSTRRKRKERERDADGWN